MEDIFKNPTALVDQMKTEGYILNERLSIALFLALAKRKPLFLEGEAGVGKTEIAKTISSILKTPMIRLQCYEGLDISQSSYEWNYGKQLISIQSTNNKNIDLFSEDFLIERPLLQALRHKTNERAVLLIDELDRADEAFEAYLLEFLSEWQITIPEIGSIKAKEPPIVIITSNRTREVHDALKRRCYYSWVDYPDQQTEMEILKQRVPQTKPTLQAELINFVQQLRERDLYKSPGIAETIDWAEALVELNCVALDPQTIDSTIGVLLKYQDDIAKIQGSEASKILNDVKIAIVTNK
mgnify:CR=1 FL=1